MAPKIFATGTTGYLGGTVLQHLLTLHADWEPHITCLVQSPARSAALSIAYPSLNFITGTLSDTQLLSDEAAKADIVLHFASSDHVGAALAIKEGLKRGVRETEGRKGKYWIHTSGTDILLKPELLNGKSVEEGVGKVKAYDDWEGIGELTEAHSHRPCDAIPLSITSPNIKTAIVCPPTIFGPGRGTGSTRSYQIYELARLTLERGRGILIPRANGTKEKVRTFWPNVHVDDLARLYGDIFESGVSELEGGKGKATWNGEGYYFAENGVHFWQDTADEIAEEAYKQGFLESESVSALKENEKDLLKPAGPALWNLGARCKGIRAGKLFGWEPKEKELRDEIGEVVRSGAERAGIAKRG